MHDRKTLMPEPVAGLEDLFEDFQIIRQSRVQYPGGQGYETLAPHGYVFVGGIPESITLERLSCALYGRPKAAVLDLVTPHLTNGDLGAFEVIAWREEGKSLVIARSRCHIGEAWVCFIQPIPEGVPASLLSRDDRKN